MALIDVRIVHAENSAVWIVALAAVVAFAFLLRQGSKTWK